LKNAVEKRLLRITWNENNWDIPSGHRWLKKNQGNSNIAHENQYGFGGEEWLFNSRYNIGGFQYGFIRGIWDVSNIDFIDEAYLFSINSRTKERFLIAKLKNIELLYIEDLSRKVKNIFDKYNHESIEELKGVNADYTKYSPKGFYPVIRFKMEDAEIFDVPRLINELKKGNKYNRFKAYIVDDKLQNLLDGVINTKPFFFSPGKRKNANSSYIKTGSGKSSKIEGLHSQIINELENYLKPEFNISLNNISVEKTAFGENVADIVVQHKDETYSIYEVKTSHNTRYNIRDAIGQLLDYALWHNNIMIKDLTIVTPSLISHEQNEFLKRLKDILKIELNYLQYTPNSDEKFQEIKL
jgi:hypothetical protein